MANVAYVRVSTVEQNEGRQVAALKPHGIEKWFIDKCSGKNRWVDSTRPPCHETGNDQRQYRNGDQNEAGPTACVDFLAE